MSLSVSSTPILLTPAEEPSYDPDLDELAEELSNIRIEMSTPTDNNDLMQQILVQLASQNLERGSSARAIKWPEWDGKKDSYSLFKWEVQAKIRNEHGRLGSNDAICTNILMSIPKSKKQRVIGWLQEQEHNGEGLSPERFLQHMDDKFLDREEERKSLDKLGRLKQGEKQKFEDFRQQFEQLASQAGSMAPTGPAKVASMRRGINSLLSEYLITARVSYTDYDAYVAEVQSIATNLEAHSKFRKQTGSSNHHYTNDDIRQPSSSKKQAIQPAKDAEGDTQMLDISAIVAQVIAQMERKGNRSTRGQDLRPRAEWKSQEVARKLREQGKCIKCEEKVKEQSSHKCKYKAAQRPQNQVSLVEPVREGEESSQSEKGADTSSGESENE
jgi:hypothetical protein